MDIRGLLQFQLANIESLTFTPAEKDPTASLVLSAQMTPEIAETMNCRRSMYDAEGRPFPGATRIDYADKKLRDVDFTLPSPDVDGQWDTYRPELISGFRIERDSEDSPTLRIVMRVRIHGRYEELATFLRDTNKKNFEFSIRSLQQEFDWTGKDGGTRVDMSGDGDDEEEPPLIAVINQRVVDNIRRILAPCEHCDNDVPRNADNLHMLPDGEVISCPRPNPEAEKPEPALASANHMGVRKAKQPKTRRTASEEEIAESVSVN